jgi:hypothetical protein
LVALGQFAVAGLDVPQGGPFAEAENPQGGLQFLVGHEAL